MALSKEALVQILQARPLESVSNKKKTQPQLWRHISLTSTVLEVSLCGTALNENLEEPETGLAAKIKEVSLLFFLSIICILFSSQMTASAFSNQLHSKQWWPLSWNSRIKGHVVIISGFFKTKFFFIFFREGDSIAISKTKLIINSTHPFWHSFKQRISTGCGLFSFLSYIQNYKI